MLPEIHLGPLTIQTFGICFAAGFLVAAGIIARRFKELGLPAEWTWEMTFSIMVGGLVGSRLDYMVENWSDGKHSDLPWAMSYPKGTVPTTDTVHPTPVYETLTMGIVALCLWQLRDRLTGGRLFALYLVLAGLERFLVEFIRRNKDVALGLTFAQLISLVMIAGGIALAARVRRVHPQPA